MRLRIALLFLLGFIAPSAPAGENALQAFKPASEAKKLASLAFKYVQRHQNQDGSYGSAEARAGKTALVLWVLADSSWKYKEADGPMMLKAMDFLLGAQKPDGGFGEGEAAGPERKTETLFALRALRAVPSPRTAAAAERAEAFLKAVGEAADGKAEGAASKLFGPRWTLLSTIQSIFAAPGPDAAQQIRTALPDLVRRQQQKNDEADDYGVVPEDPPGDPLVDTLLAGRIGDLIRSNWKSVEPAPQP